MKRICLSWLLLSLLLAASWAHAGSFTDRFVDPRDGQFDASDWLLEHKGFLPMPILITEPAVGYGGGVVLLFFHKSMDEQIAAMQTVSDEEEAAGVKKRLMPPSLSGVYGLGTQNGTWAGGGFHFGSWKGDRIRYLGDITRASINIKYYGREEDSLLSDGIDYELDGWFMLHDLLFRVGDSDVFVGGRLTWFDAISYFDFGELPGDIQDWELDFNNLGFGFVFQYDSRDNIFNPPHRHVHQRAHHVLQRHRGGQPDSRIPALRLRASLVLGTAPRLRAGLAGGGQS